MLRCQVVIFLTRFEDFYIFDIISSTSSEYILSDVKSGFGKTTFSRGRGGNNVSFNDFFLLCSK